MRREETKAVRAIMQMNVERQKKRKNKIKKDMVGYG